MPYSVDEFLENKLNRPIELANSLDVPTVVVVGTPGKAKPKVHFARELEFPVQDGEGFFIFASDLPTDLYEQNPSENILLEYSCKGKKGNIASYQLYGSMEDAVGAYLHILHKFGAPRNAAENAVEDRIPKLYHQYKCLQEEQSQADNREKLISQLKQRSEMESLSRPFTDPLSEYYLDVGSFRDTSPAPEGYDRLVEQLLPNGFTPVNECHRTVVSTFLNYLDEDCIKFGGGVCLPSESNYIVPHCWLEVDGHVIDPTWKWHQPWPPNDAVYYGYSLPLKHAALLMKKLPQPSYPAALLLADEAPKITKLLPSSTVELPETDVNPIQGVRQESTFNEQY